MDELRHVTSSENSMRDSRLTYICRATYYFQSKEPTLCIVCGASVLYELPEASLSENLAVKADLGLNAISGNRILDLAFALDTVKVTIWIR